MTGAYYNEIDPYAAQWLRNLIAAGHIAPGEVDERSIEDVTPDDLRGFTQCHFFAGIGVWSHALRLAGWPDNKPVWTGSCPCQPFSAAGKGAGFADERHLWPALFGLIRERRPELVFGEQVAGGNAWFDLVQTDLEAVDYAFGLVPFPAAGVGAPHIRDRAYWVADTSSQRSVRWRKRFNCIEENRGRTSPVRTPDQLGFEGLCSPGGRAHTDLQYESATRNTSRTRQSRRGGEIVGLANPDGLRCGEGRQLGGLPEVSGRGEDERMPTAFTGAGSRPDALNDFWRSADWLSCRDGRWRPVEPGTFPLAHGDPTRVGRLRARVGRLRAYGNAIVAPAAALFIRSYMECAGYDLI